MNELSSGEKAIIADRAFEIAGNIGNGCCRTATFVQVEGGMVRISVHAMTHEDCDKLIEASTIRIQRPIDGTQQWSPE